MKHKQTDLEALEALEDGVELEVQEAMDTITQGKMAMGVMEDTTIIRMGTVVMETVKT